MLGLEGAAGRSHGVPSIVGFRAQHVHFHCKIHGSRAQGPVGPKFGRGGGGGGVELCRHRKLVEDVCFGQLGPRPEFLAQGPVVPRVFPEAHIYIEVLGEPWGSRGL